MLLLCEPVGDGAVWYQSAALAASGVLDGVLMGGPLCRCRPILDDARGGPEHLLPKLANRPHQRKKKLNKLQWK